MRCDAWSDQRAARVQRSRFDETGVIRYAVSTKAALSRAQHAADIETSLRVRSVTLRYAKLRYVFILLTAP